MASHSRQPEVLSELFEALGNDPFVIAECLVKPMRSANDSSKRNHGCAFGVHEGDSSFRAAGRST